MFQTHHASSWSTPDGGGGSGEKKFGGGAGTARRGGPCQYMLAPTPMAGSGTHNSFRLELFQEFKLRSDLQTTENVNGLFRALSVQSQYGQIPTEKCQCNAPKTISTCFCHVQMVCYDYNSHEQKIMSHRLMFCPSALKLKLGNI